MEQIFFPLFCMQYRTLLIWPILLNHDWLTNDCIKSSLIVYPIMTCGFFKMRKQRNKINRRLTFDDYDDKSTQQFYQRKTKLTHYFYHISEFKSSFIISAAFSAIIIVGMFGFPTICSGNTEASTTRSPVVPNTRKRLSTTVEIPK